MTEITTYKCDFCGQVFDDEEECSNHEWQCRCEALREAENCEPLKLFNNVGAEINYLNCPECDEIEAVEIHSYAQARSINGYFNRQGYEAPVKIVSGQVEHYGLWYYDPDYCHGAWRSYKEALEDIQSIGKKFNQGTC